MCGLVHLVQVLRGNAIDFVGQSRQRAWLGLLAPQFVAQQLQYARDGLCLRTGRLALKVLLKHADSERLSALACETTAAALSFGGALHCHCRALLLLDADPGLNQQSLDALDIARRIGDIERNQCWVVAPVELVARIVEEA
jgi:hypothetical protein